MRQYKGVWVTDESDKIHEKIEDGIYNKPLFDTSMKYIKNWDIALDLGAHIGTWTKALAGRFKDVLAFEMIPEYYDILKKNTEGMSNVWPYNRAIMHCPTRVGIKKLSSLSTHITIDGNETECLALDQLSYPGKVGFIKMNIEGAEPFALMGATLLILRDKPIITLERKYETRFGMPKEACQRFLALLGYKKIESIGKCDIYEVS